MNNIQHWVEKDGQLYRELKFPDFTEAFSFMTKIALMAQQYDHHPTLKNAYNIVEVWLSTHDAGDKVTALDRDMAAAIETAFQNKLK